MESGVLSLPNTRIYSVSPAMLGTTMTEVIAYVTNAFYDPIVWSRLRYLWNWLCSGFRSYDLTILLSFKRNNNEKGNEVSHRPPMSFLPKRLIPCCTSCHTIAAKPFVSSPDASLLA
jgi:hypothetical protein